MEYEETLIPKDLIVTLINEWIEKNPDSVHPSTDFYSSIGLTYLRLSRNGSFVRCRIDDKKKLFMFKIKYGI